MGNHVDRRTFLGTAAVSGLGFLAGCGGSETDEPTESTTETGNAPSEVTEYLADTDNFDGTVADETGSDAATVAVGAEGNGGYYAFSPAAVRIDTGTTVTWRWTGEGSLHNVVHEDGEFESEQVSEADHEFQHTFEESGTYLYYCTPHQALGMNGAVVVE